MQNDRELSIFFRRERENGFDEKLAGSLHIPGIQGLKDRGGGKNREIGTGWIFEVVHDLIEICEVDLKEFLRIVT